MDLSVFIRMTTNIEVDGAYRFDQSYTDTYQESIKIRPDLLSRRVETQRGSCFTRFELIIAIYEPKPYMLNQIQTGQ